MSRITLCEQDQKVNILIQLDDLLEIVCYSKVNINGQIFRNCNVIKHTKQGYTIIKTKAALLTQNHFVGKVAKSPKIKKSGGANV